MAFRRIGLTGNIGGGKSEVAKILAHQGIAVVNLDDLGRALCDKPNVIEAVAKVLGIEIRDGKLDRAEIRKLIFADAKRRKALEGLLHPLIWNAFQKECDRLRANGHAFVICEAALLYETGISKQLDGVIVVSANPAVRRTRLSIRDATTEEEFNQIEKAQETETDKLKRATYIIDNSGSIDALRPQVLSLVNRWKAAGYFP